MHAFGTCLLARQRLFRQVICMGRIERNGKVWLKSMMEGYLESNHGPHASVTCKFYDFLRRSDIVWSRKLQNNLTRIHAAVKKLYSVAVMFKFVDFVTMKVNVTQECLRTAQWVNIYKGE